MDAAFNLVVKHEIDGPAHGVADHIGGKASIETFEESLIACNTSNNAEGAPQCERRRILADWNKKSGQCNDTITCGHTDAIPSN